MKPRIGPMASLNPHQTTHQSNKFCKTIVFLESGDSICECVGVNSLLFKPSLAMSACTENPGSSSIA